MTSSLAPILGLAWGALVLVTVARHRPAPARVRTLAGDVTAVRRRRVALGDLARTIGRLVGRRRDEHEQRRLGGAVVAAAVAAALVPSWPVAPVAAATAAGVAWWWPAHRRRRRTRQRARDIARDVPDVIDLFLLAVDAGLTVPLALRAVARRTAAGPDAPLGDELARTVDAIDLGRRTADALDDLAEPGRAGDAVRPLVAALAASERYGAPLAGGLARLADEARRQRRRRAEEAARRLPVTLLFPLVTCTLPAFGLLTVGPLIASASRSLRL